MSNFPIFFASGLLIGGFVGCLWSWSQSVKLRDLKDENMRLAEHNASLRKRALPFEINTAVKWTRNKVSYTGHVYAHVGAGEQFFVPAEIDGVRTIERGNLSRALLNPSYIIRTSFEDSVELRRPDMSRLKAGA